MLSVGARTQAGVVCKNSDAFRLQSPLSCPMSGSLQRVLSYKSRGLCHYHHSKIVSCCSCPTHGSLVNDCPSWCKATHFAQGGRVSLSGDIGRTTVSEGGPHKRVLGGRRSQHHRATQGQWAALGEIRGSLQRDEAGLRKCSLKHQQRKTVGHQSN